MPTRGAGDPATSAGAGAKAHSNGAESPAKIRLTPEQREEVYRIFVDKNIADQRVDGNVEKRRDAFVAFLEEYWPPGPHTPTKENERAMNNRINTIIREVQAILKGKGSPTGDSAGGTGGDGQQEAGVGGVPQVQSVQPSPAVTPKQPTKIGLDSGRKRRGEASGSSANKARRQLNFMPQEWEGDDSMKRKEVSEPFLSNEDQLKRSFLESGAGVVVVGGDALKMYDRCRGRGSQWKKKTDSSSDINFVVRPDISEDAIGPPSDSSWRAVKDFVFQRLKPCGISMDNIKVTREDTKSVDAYWGSREEGSYFYGRYRVTFKGLDERYEGSSDLVWDVTFGGWPDYRCVLSAFDWTVCQIAMVYEEGKFFFKCLNDSAGHIDNLELHLNEEVRERIAAKERDPEKVRERGDDLKILGYKMPDAVQA